MSLPEQSFYNKTTLTVDGTIHMTMEVDGDSVIFLYKNDEGLIVFELVLVADGWDTPVLDQVIN
ncbi:hypothetical protein LCGC14_1101640 [marine sediment metagenome]|uniref:Uncharacterized protein n=1 Tax=marine sediment metagenome TaxID=412755 RepID=A0A0F9MX55_9ZZZZ